MSHKCSCNNDKTVVVSPCNRGCSLNNGYGSNNCWLIIFILLLCNGCGNLNNCGCENTGCGNSGSGNNCSCLIILLLLICGCGGNNFGC